MITSQVVAELVAAGLTGNALVAALRRIEDASHETSQPSAGALRTRRWRESKKASPTVTETSRDVTETEPTNTNIDSVTHETSIGVGASPSPTSPRRTATRLPEDWRPKSLSADFKARLGFDQERLAAEFEQFRDHFLAKPGEKGRSMDWDRSWHTWLRNAVKWDTGRNSRSTSNGQPPRNSLSEGFKVVDNFVNELKRREGGESFPTDEANSGSLPRLRQGTA